MKKITSLFTALAISAISSVDMASASEAVWNIDDLFVGIEGGFGYNETSVNLQDVAGPGITASIIDYNTKNKNIGLRLGGYYSDEIRAYISISQNKVDLDKAKLAGPNNLDLGSLKQMNFLVSADYLFMQDSEIHPFVGASLGMANNKLKRGSDSYDKWGLSFGLQAGVLYQIDNFDLEAGLKLQSNSADIKFDDVSDDATFKLNNLRQLYVAASVYF